MKHCNVSASLPLIDGEWACSFTVKHQRLLCNLHHYLVAILLSYESRIRYLQLR